jgi:hypothetical protein
VEGDNREMLEEGMMLATVIRGISVIEEEDRDISLEKEEGKGTDGGDVVVVYFS